MHGGSTLGSEGTQVPKSWLAPKLWIGPKFSRTLDTLWSIDSLKNSKLDATRCQILRLKWTKFGFHPDSAGEAYSAPPDPLAVFKEKLKRAAPFLFAHPVNRLYSLAQLSMVQECIGVWKNMLLYWLHWQNCFSFVVRASYLHPSGLLPRPRSFTCAVPLYKPCRRRVATCLWFGGC